MNKKEIFIIAVLLTILIFGVGLYISSLKSFNSPLSEEIKQEKKQLSEEEKFILDRYKKYRPFEQYFIEYVEGWKKGGIDKKVITKIKQAQDKIDVLVEHNWFEMQAVYEDNKTIYCLKIFNKEKECADVSNSTEFKIMAEELKNRTNNMVVNQEEKEFVEYLINNSWIEILDGIKNKEIEKFQCKGIKYKIDYQKLTQPKVIEEMKKKNMSFERFGAGYLKELEEEECFDEKNWLIIYKKIDYKDIFEGSGGYSFRVMDFQPNLTEITSPVINTDVAGLERRWQKVSGIEKQLTSCLEKSDNKINCYFLTAIDNKEGEVCSMIENDKNATEGCYYQYAIRTSSPEFCPKTNLKTDYCYIDYVALNKEKNPKNYCNLITDSEIKKQCFELLK
ncbi:MAG: hypothetical protein ACK4J0_03895 [Candidatus Anstonellaceae archaeon]